MYKILIIEDDEAITGVLKRNLTQWGYMVQTVQDFNGVIQQFNDYKPHLVLMDISLPFYNGYHWCAEIRKISQVPIIFISSAADNMNFVMAINQGADDFVAKPFELNVVIAKIQAVLRRTYDFGADNTCVAYGDVVLNLSTDTISCANDKVQLTNNESKIMQTLLMARGNTVLRENIIQKLWESEDYIDDNTLTVNITRLRKKLENTSMAALIETQKGKGYFAKVH